MSRPVSELDVSSWEVGILLHNNLHWLCTMSTFIVKWFAIINSGALDASETIPSNFLPFGNACESGLARLAVSEGLSTSANCAILYIRCSSFLQCMSCPPETHGGSEGLHATPDHGFPDSTTFLGFAILSENLCAVHNSGAAHPM